MYLVAISHISNACVINRACKYISVIHILSIPQSLHLDQLSMLKPKGLFMALSAVQFLCRVSHSYVDFLDSWESWYKLVIDIDHLS